MRNSGFELPDWMLKLKNPSKGQKRKLKTVPVHRKDVRKAVGYAPAVRKNKKTGRGNKDAKSGSKKYV